MEYIKLAKVTDFKKDWIRSYRILGKFVAIVKEPDGSFYATEIACKHNNADLTSGRFNKTVVTCPRHGWIYDIRTGECLNRPSAPLRRHELKIEGDQIFVSVRPVSAEPQPPDDDEPYEIVFKN